MAELKLVRVNPKVVEEFKAKHPELKELGFQDLVSVMLRKALEVEKCQ